ncbi:hypothetical protein AAVH_42391, partial [Aphelenchoides avenae]
MMEVEDLVARGAADFEFLRELFQSGGVCQSIWVYEKHSNVLGAHPDFGLVFTITIDDASAGSFRWSKKSRIAERFLYDHPCGPLIPGFQFHRQLCDKSYQTWDRLNLTHTIGEVITRRYLPHCVTTPSVCCAADRLYDDTAYRSYAADVRDLVIYLSKLYPYLCERIIHPMFMPDRLDQWSEVILPANDKLRNVLAALVERELMYQTYLLFIDLSVDRYLLKIHRRTGRKSPELATPSACATFFGLEMRLNEIWRCYGLDLGDSADPGPAPVPQEVSVPPSQHPQDTS